ncbi:MAG: SDR family NAD(P)-dependent oxidoreductase [Nitrospinota bacterium]
MKGKVAVVTGGAQGIGKAVAHQFAVAGADVCIADINYDLAKEASEEIRQIGVKCIVVDLDTSEYLQVEQMVKKVVKELGSIDILVNNAAFVQKSPFLEYTKESWSKIIDVCLNGYFYCGQHAARAMVEKGVQKGKIINLSSIAGFIPHGGLMAYTVAKAGVLALTRVMAHELKKNDIAVNAVVPAITDTPLMTGVLGKMGEGKGPPLPKSAISTSEDVAEVVLKVAQDENNILTGNLINVGSAAIGM